MQMAQKGKNGRTFAFGQELWYTRKKKKGRICMEIRKGTLKDLEAIAAVEAACFPVARGGYGRGVCRAAAAVRRSFWLLWEGERLLAFVDGFCTDWPDLTDEMYADASLHRENGAWQMIFGVNTIPACRRQGYAGQLLQQALPTPGLKAGRGWY